jgi:hypothetical protein
MAMRTEISHGLNNIVNYINIDVMVIPRVLKPSILFIKHYKLLCSYVMKVTALNLGNRIPFLPFIYSFLNGSSTPLLQCIIQKLGN